MGLSVAIPAKNEERYIAGCLDSVSGLADEIVVALAPDSSDRTAEICQQRGARIEWVTFVSFAQLRNDCLALCRQPWVFFLDADEVAQPELCREITTAIQQAPDPADSEAFVGYWIPRYNYFFGRRVGHGGWYPDHQLRLLWRERAHYPEHQRVHEVVQLQGQAGYLQEHFWHYNIDTLEEFQRKQRRYARLEAEMFLQQGQRARPHSLLTQPWKEFYRRYIQLQGWRDGPLGLFLCAAMGYYRLHTVRHLLQKQQEWPSA
ncbi:MAG: glycosyltransferase family 2 protein [Chloroflexia bacterium]|nr:glycosyltransferase family 2 protein [Chloroflexia bacterium]